jgi:hypothetical protein
MPLNSSPIETLVIGFDPMIALPIHFQLEHNILKKKMPVMLPGFKLSDISALNLKNETDVVVRTALTDFKDFFKQHHFFSVIDLNMISFDDDCRKVARYLFAEKSDLKSYLMGYLSVEKMTLKIVSSHSNLVDLTLNVFEKDSTFADYELSLKKLQISEDTHLTWLSQLPVSIRHSVCRNFFAFLLNYQTEKYESFD